MAPTAAMILFGASVGNSWSAPATHPLALAVSSRGGRAAAAASRCQDGARRDAVAPEERAILFDQRDGLHGAVDVVGRAPAPPSQAGDGLLLSSSYVAVEAVEQIVLASAGIDLRQEPPRSAGRCAIAVPRQSLMIGSGVTGGVADRASRMSSRLSNSAGSACWRVLPSWLRRSCSPRSGRWPPA